MSRLPQPERGALCGHPRLLRLRRARRRTGSVCPVPGAASAACVLRGEARGSRRGSGRAFPPGVRAPRTRGFSDVHMSKLHFPMAFHSAAACADTRPSSASSGESGRVSRSVKPSTGRTGSVRLGEPLDLARPSLLVRAACDSPGCRAGGKPGRTTAGGTSASGSVRVLIRGRGWSPRRAPRSAGPFFLPLPPAACGSTARPPLLGLELSASPMTFWA